MYTFDLPLYTVQWRVQLRSKLEKPVADDQSLKRKTKWATQDFGGVWDGLV